MNPQCQTAMKAAISNVLETMFFTTVLYEGANEPQVGETPPYQFESNIMIHGDSQEITLFCLSTDRFARMITANFLGVDENELSVVEIGDAMKELANMAAGELVTRFSQGAWRLGIPEFEEIKLSFKRYPGKGMASLRLYDEDGPLALALCRWIESGP
jgi:CheY-specific phosphatase CheX